MDFIGSGTMALSLAGDKAIPAFDKLTKIIKEPGARAWVQLFRAGAYSYPMLLKGDAPIAPSALYSRYSKAMPREMTLEDIENVRN